MKHRLCNECYAATGHAEWCVSKGYAGVGPHPDAPPDTARAPVRSTPPAQCPCGIARADCEYHAVASAPAYEVYDDTRFNLRTYCGVRMSWGELLGILKV